MNKKRLLETIVFAGALTGLLMWFMYGNNMQSAKDLTNTNGEQASKVKIVPEKDKAFSTLQKSADMPAEVNDATVSELDGYILGVDNTGSEDLSDLE